MSASKPPPRPRKRRRALLHGLAALVFAAAASLSAEQTEPARAPNEVVKETIGAVMGVLSDERLSPGEKRVRVMELASLNIDFEGMSQRILAARWSAASPQQQRRFIELFRRFLLNTFWVRIRKYSDERVVYFTASLDGGRFATVDTVIISDQVEIPITYRLERHGGTWIAYDFLIESMSLVQNYRTSFSTTLKTDGLESLLEQLARQAREFESAG